MGESDSPNVPPLAQEPGSQSRQEPPVVGSAAGPPGGGLPPLQVAPPPQETETDKHAERPHRITILLALLALIISVASASCTPSSGNGDGQARRTPAPDNDIVGFVGIDHFSCLCKLHPLLRKRRRTSTQNARTG